MGLKVRLHGRAERDLQDIIDHRARKHGSLVAEHVHDELLEAVRRLALHPSSSAEAPPPPASASCP